MALYGNDYNNFLLDLDQVKNKVIYAKVTALDINEAPIETIEGRINGGSINIDGASALRRTCSLTLLAQDFNYSNYVWGLNTKFKLEIGVQNNINTNFDDIIWFKQGIFVLTSFNTSRSTNNFSISLQGKDKMCLLNGDVGGTLDASIDFGTIEEEDKNGIWTIRKLPIREIIRNIVHTYGGEPYHNIVINDLEMTGLELLEYRYDTPMYLYRKPDVMVYTNILLENEKTQVFTSNNEEEAAKTLVSLTGEYLDPLLNSKGENHPIVYIDGRANANKWVLSRISYGDTAGYRLTDLTYAGDLIANAGESIMSVLDKIKNMLAEFEYFYDLDGRFVFQKKQSFIATMWTPSSDTDSNGNYITESLGLYNSYAYYFGNNELVTSLNNNPNILNVKNDYSVWGEREGISGGKIPIHLRYAIDTKPIKYTQIVVSDEEVRDYNEKYNTLLQGRSSVEVKTYVAGNSYSINGNIITCDWREVLYQMAKDYFKYNYLDDFELKVIAANIHNGLYTTGQTKYEQYYTDMQGFWRELYNPEITTEITDLTAEIALMSEKLENTKKFLYGTKNEYGIVTHGFVTKLSRLNDTKDPDEAKKFVDDSRSIYDSYEGKHYISRKFEKPEEYGNVDAIIEAAQNIYQNTVSLITINENELTDKKEKHDFLIEDAENFYSDGEHKHWNKNVFEEPEKMNFWFDFLDSEGDLANFSVKAIGSRSKVVNDTNINSIYFRDTPDVIFQECGADYENISNVYKSIQVPNIDNMFMISSQGKSAQDKLDELLYQHGYCSETITINAIPIYYLQPNTRIHIHDDDTSLDGDYIVNKITLPLTYNGTMSITATKAATNIL